MRLRELLLRRSKAIAAATLTTGALIFSSAQGGDAAQEVNRWSSDATAAVAKIDNGQRAAPADLPQPPADSVLSDASSDGYAFGLALDAMAQGLGSDLSEASDSNLSETIEDVREAVCFAFIWYLEHGTMPQSPAEMEAQIERYLAGRHFPVRELPRVKRDLEVLYEMAHRAGSVDKLQAEVADAVLC